MARTRNANAMQELMAVAEAANGEVTLDELEAALGWPRQSVSSTLTNATRKGLLRRVRPKTYALPKHRNMKARIQVANGNGHQRRDVHAALDADERIAQAMSLLFTKAPDYRTLVQWLDLTKAMVN